MDRPSRIVLNPQDFFSRGASKFSQPEEAIESLNDLEISRNEPSDKILAPEVVEEKVEVQEVDEQKK